MFVRTASKSVVSFALGLAMACAMFPGTAQAQPALNKKTSLTFSQPIEIPGVGAQVLPAGTYVFKLLDSKTDRHIVQIFSKDEKHLYATILAIPNYRLKTTNHTTITFAERGAGSPPALRAWFKGGDNWGQEFVYPKARAMEIAKATNQPVLFVPTELATTIVAPVTEATEPPVTALYEAPIMALKPTGEVVPMTEVVEAPPVETAAMAPAKAKRLPKTADDMALIGLLGLLSIGAAGTIRKLSSR
jgi:hypothetical protein